MAKRRLRIVRDRPRLGICEYCNMQFPASKGDVTEQFEAHKCKREDFSQAAVRTVREATEK
jgi:hypothetical protein